jgi:hypothetical protein
MVKIYRSFGFTFDGYVEVEIIPFLGETEDKTKKRAEEILEQNLSNIFGSYPLGNGVTVDICGRNTLGEKSDILFEAKIEENNKKSPMGKYRKITPVEKVV